MKASKICAGIIATSTALISQAEIISGGALDGRDTAVATAADVSAIAIITSKKVGDGLRTMQGIPATCQGNLSVLCAPSISSAELRSILTNQINASWQIQNAAGDDLGTVAGILGKQSVVQEFAADGVFDALRAFLHSGVVGGFLCGQGGSLLVNQHTATDSDTIIGVAGNPFPVFGFVHATELDGSVGFIKLDGVAPSLLELASSNYELVSNLSAGAAVADVSVNETVTGIVANIDGVASHSPVACSPLTTGAEIMDAD